MPTGSIKIVTEFGIITHSKSTREYWIEHDTYQVKRKRNMGMTSISISPILEMFSSQILGQLFNPHSIDIPKINLKTALETFMKGNATSGTSSTSCFVKALPASLICDSIRCSCKKLALDAVQAIHVEKSVRMES